ncbi:hypothetical protein GCM10027291_02980 [Telluribacter humicola]
MNLKKYLLFQLVLGVMCYLTSCRYMSYTSSKAGVWGGIVMLVVVIIITVYIVAKTLTKRE